MRAIRYDSAGVGGLVDVAVPTAGPGDLVVRVGSSGICGTDLHIIAEDYPVASLPRVIGHEFAGRVTQVGPGVEGFAVGDLVAADPNSYCGQCAWCRQGAYNLCTSWGAVGLTTDGAMAEYVRVGARFAVKLPEGMDAEVGALIEPLSCVLHGFEMADFAPGHALLVYGAGMLGLSATIVAQARDLDVYVVEPHAFRRAKAVELGAVAAAADVAGLGGPATFDCVLDATGVPAAIEDGVAHLGVRGTYLQMGVAPTAARLTLSPYVLYEREWTIVGSMSLADQYVPAAELMPSIADQMRALVTHRYPLEQFDEAMAAMRTPEAIKVHIRPDLDD